MSISFSTSGGTSLELERAEPEFGTLDLGGEEVKMNVWSDQAVQHISGSEQKWQLVPGKYTAHFIELYKTDSSGSRWTFRCTRKRGKLEDFEIQSGRICSFKIGPPFLINTTAEQRNDTVAIGFDLEGRAGELYSPAASKANTRISKPTFKIINEASEVVDSGLFEYGWGGVCRYSWRVPSDFKGKYQVQVDVDLGPFEIKQDQTSHLIE